MVKDLLQQLGIKKSKNISNSPGKKPYKFKKDPDGNVIGGTSIIRIKGEVKKPKTNATAVKPAQGPVSNPSE